MYLERITPTLILLTLCSEPYSISEVSLPTAYSLSCELSLCEAVVFSVPKTVEDDSFFFNR